MGNGGSSDGGGNGAFSAQCYGEGAPGLNQYCYTTGYDHGKGTNDTIGDGIGAFPCTTNDQANYCYGQGYADANDRDYGDGTG